MLKGHGLNAYYALWSQDFIIDKCRLVNLKPALVFKALKGSNYFEKSLFPQTYSGISSGKVGIERSWVELGKSIYLVYITVNAVADNCINKPVICCYRNCPFCSSLCQWVKPWLWPITKNNSRYTLTSINSQKFIQKHTLPLFQTHAKEKQVKEPITNAMKKTIKIALIIMNVCDSVWKNNIRKIIWVVNFGPD